MEEFASPARPTVGDVICPQPGLMMKHANFINSATGGVHKKYAYLSALLISLYALDVFVPFIDAFGLPLPRYLFSISLSAIFIIWAFCILIPLAKSKYIALIGIPDLVLLALLGFWGGIELIGAAGFRSPSFELTLEFVPLALVLAASRIHLKLFGDERYLMIAMVLTGGTLVLIFTFLLLADRLQIPLPFIVVSELYERNGMSLIVPVCLWLLVFFPLRQWPVFGYRYNLLLGLALINILLNSARTALFILIWCVLVGAIFHQPLIRRLLRVFLIPTVFVLVVTVSFSYPIVQALDEQKAWGEGDGATSVLSRSYSNILLLKKLVQDPVLGVGWKEVSTSKAFGYMGHTLYVNLLAASGVLGALAAICALSFGILRVQGINREIATHLLFLALLISSFSNNVFGYFGVIIALIANVKGTLENSSFQDQANAIPMSYTKKP